MLKIFGRKDKYIFKFGIVEDIWSSEFLSFDEAIKAAREAAPLDTEYCFIGKKRKLKTCVSERQVKQFLKFIELYIQCDAINEEATDYKIYDDELKADRKALKRFKRRLEFLLNLYFLETKKYPKFYKAENVKYTNLHQKQGEI